MTANVLAASGNKVLCIDADPQNSMTFYYQPDNTEIKESLANVLDTGSIKTNIVLSGGNAGIDLVPSSLELINRRNNEVNVLATALESVRSEYDYCVIDTAPNFDNVVLNCLAPSDVIVTPVNFSGFDFKSALFYQNLLMGMGLDKKWRILFNKFKPIKTGNSLAAQYLDVYVNAFGSRIILKSRIPESSLIKQYFDTANKITQAKNKMPIFEAITELAEEITGQTLNPEAF